MAKVLKIVDTKAVVGMDDGSTKTFDLADFNYNPLIGDMVEIYGSDENPIISKAEGTTPVPGQGNNGAGSQNVYVNVQPQSVTTSGKKKVNKVAYCLLALFTGGVGIHEFYAGHIGAGVVMILFCWTGIPAIIAFVQFIMALCKSSDANGMIEV